jgi:phosphoserine phosphatase
MTDFVATLIARPQDAEALAKAVAACSAALGATRTVVLGDGEAVDLFLTAPRSVTDLRESARSALADLPVDFIVQPSAGRRKKLLIADMDSTIIGQECIDELADFVGLKARVAAITERAMRGEIAFEPALRERVSLLAGLSVGAIDQVLAERITLTPGANELVRTMRADGATTLLVSGGFTAFTEKIAAMVGFDENHANRLLVSEGKLTGGVAEPNLGRSAKLAALEETITRLGIQSGDTMAVGDGANDLAMIGRAGLGVAFQAKPQVAEAADAQITNGNLTALLYAQGYHRHEFVR